MALWLVRAGKYGEYEERFLDESRIYLTWERLVHDLARIKTKQDLRSLLDKAYPDAKPPTVSNWTGQVWPFAHEMKEGDWIVLPSKLANRPIHFAEIVGPYTFTPGADIPFLHSRQVNWLATGIPRSNFDQELLKSFGALQTVCRISREGAEERVRAMAEAGWKLPSDRDTATSDHPHQERELEELPVLQLDRSSRSADWIKKISQKPRGHDPGQPTDREVDRGRITSAEARRLERGYVEQVEARLKGTAALSGGKRLAWKKVQQRDSLAQVLAELQPPPSAKAAEKTLPLGLQVRAELHSGGLLSKSVSLVLQARVVNSYRELYRTGFDKPLSFDDMRPYLVEARKLAGDLPCVLALASPAGWDGECQDYATQGKGLRLEQGQVSLLLVGLKERRMHYCQDDARLADVLPYVRVLE